MKRSRKHPKALTDRGGVRLPIWLQDADREAELAAAERRGRKLDAELHKNEEDKDMKKNCNPNITEVVFILDRSGSMHGLEADTIGGFNSMLEKQKQTEGEVLVSTLLFDDVTEVLHDRVKLSDIRPLTRDDYTVRGCTALLDAVGGAIRHTRTVQKYARAEDRPAHTLFVITTDGLENASRLYTAEQVRHLIEKQQAEQGWEFIFLGANIDAVQTAAGLGIRADRAANYHADAKGTALNFASIACAMSDMRMGKGINREWAGGINADYASRESER